VCVCVYGRTNVRVHAQEEGKLENFTIYRSLVIMDRGLPECMSAFSDNGHERERVCVCGMSAFLDNGHERERQRECVCVRVYVRRS